MDCLPGPSSRPIEIKEGSRIGDSGVDGGEAEAGEASWRRISVASKRRSRAITSESSSPRVAQAASGIESRDVGREAVGFSGSKGGS